MKKKILKPVGDQLFTKVDFRSQWMPASLAELKTILSKRTTPYSKEEKLDSASLPP